MPHDECKCSRDLEKLELADQFAEYIAAEIGDTFGGICAPMMDFFVERLIARVAHMQALSHDETLGSEPNLKLLNAVEKNIFRLSGTAPAALKVILDEARVREGDSNARH